MSYFLFFIATVLAGTINALAGGGGLITFPLLMLIVTPVTPTPQARSLCSLLIPPLCGAPGTSWRCLDSGWYGCFDSKCARRVDRSVPLRTADTTTLDLGRGPELCESAWPTSVGNTVPSGVRHALAQRSIGHERSNRACEVFDIMRPGDQTVCLVRH